MRTNIICVAILSCLALVAFVPAAQATTLATTGHALNDGNGPSGGIWQGSQNYAGAGFFGGTLQGTVEFAVFAPNNFQNFLNENGITFADPATSEYIYAYQITSVGGTNDVTNFTVGLQADEAAGSSGVTFVPVGNYGAYAPAPVQDPAITGGGPGGNFSSAWSHLPGLPAGQASGILFYSSPEVPELGFSTMAAGTASQQIALSLPNPQAIPEPATIALAVFSASCLFIRRRSV